MLIVNTCESSRANSDFNSSEGEDNGEHLCTGLCLPVRGGEGKAIVGAGVEGENLPENKLIVQLFHQIIIVHRKPLIPKLSGIIGWFIAMLAIDCYVGGLEGGWVVWTWGGALIIELTYTRRGLACKQLHR